MRGRGRVPHPCGLIPSGCLPNRLELRRPGLLIFDCDGVLVDSELIDARIRCECFQAGGFPVTAEDLRQNPGISSD